MPVAVLLVEAVCAAATGAAFWFAWQLTRQVSAASTLHDFLLDVVQEVLARPERVAMVEICLALSRDAELRGVLARLASGIAGRFPRCQVDINLLGAEDDTRLVVEDQQVVPIDPVVPCRDSFCQFTLAAGRLVEIPDTHHEPTLRSSPYVDVVRAYLGNPIVVGGEHVGVVCVYQPQPRVQWAPWEREALTGFAADVAEVFEAAMRVDLRSPRPAP